MQAYTIWCLIMRTVNAVKQYFGHSHTDQQLYKDEVWARITQNAVLRNLVHRVKHGWTCSSKILDRAKQLIAPVQERRGPAPTGRQACASFLSTIPSTGVSDIQLAWGFWISPIKSRKAKPLLGYLHRAAAAVIGCCQNLATRLVLGVARAKRTDVVQYLLLEI